MTIKQLLLAYDEYKEQQRHLRIEEGLRVDVAERELLRITDNDAHKLLALREARMKAIEARNTKAIVGKTADGRTATIAITEHTKG